MALMTCPTADCPRAGTPLEITVQTDMVTGEPIPLGVVVCGSCCAQLIDADPGLAA